MTANMTLNKEYQTIDIFINKLYVLLVLMLCIYIFFCVSFENLLLFVEQKLTGMILQG